MAGRRGARFSRIVACGGALLAACGSSDAAAPDDATIVSISVSPPALSLRNAGATANLTATVIGRGGAIADAVVTWTSSDSAVATVAGSGATGTVIAVGRGTALITAAAGSVSAAVLTNVITPAGPPRFLVFDWHDVTGFATGDEASAGPVTWSVDRFLWGQGGAVVVSPDGIAWERFPLPAGNAAEPVATWTGQGYVVAGAPGAMLTSPDGRTWTSHVVGTRDVIRKLVWAGGRVVGMGGTGSMIGSSDAIAWTATSALTGGSLHDILWTGTRWVVAAGEVTLASTDGVSWQTSAQPPDPVFGLVWTGSEMLGYGPRVLQSTDGLGWTIVDDYTSSAAIPAPETVLRLGSVFGGCESGGAGRMLFSADGVTWYRAPAPEPLPGCEGLAWDGSRVAVSWTGGLSIGAVVN